VQPALVAFASCVPAANLRGVIPVSESAQAVREESRGAEFRTTHWTLVMAAAQPGCDPARAAFAQLYTDYWYPLYAYVRRRGSTPAEAEDLTQGFFARLLEKEALGSLKRDGGRFRSFLLGALNNYLANEWDRARAQKRGAGMAPISLHAEEGETRYLVEPADGETPESAYERQWVFTLLERVTQALAREYADSGKERLFERLKPCLHSPRLAADYAALGMEFGLSEGAVKVAVHRMRQRYGELLRAEVTRTVSTPQEVEEEIRYLISVVGR
jgi:RNA polymerase sigma factor (sigma-70 family)